jgi:hypothetical protein
MFYGKRLQAIDARLRKLENTLAAVAQADERRQNEWREVKEQIVDQMTEIRQLLRPTETRVE